MANPELISKLKEGANAWNKWFASEGKYRQIDLLGADLSGVHLPGVELLGINLDRSDLRGANLENANLSHAKLNHSILEGANLTRANLRDARLKGANMRDCVLLGADLTRAFLDESVLVWAKLNASCLDGAIVRMAEMYSADLSGASLLMARDILNDLVPTQLTGSNLTSANFEEAQFDGTDFKDTNLTGIRVRNTVFRDVVFGRTIIENVDLSGIIGLESCRHAYPSTLTDNVIRLSRELVPRAFLEGCGYSSMKSKAQVQIFLCHAKEDSQRVHAIYTQLKQAGFRPWLDKENLLPGQDWDEQIRVAIRSSTYALLFFSRVSILKRGYVQKEYKLARDVLDEIPAGQIFIIPVRLDDCAIPDRFAHLQYCDLFQNDGFGKLLRSIESDLS